MPDTSPKITVAIAGNPNCGKTCLFNNLTGARQRVGNWPGVTVEQKRGTFAYAGREFEVIDLPGTYSLSAYSIEEEVVAQFLRETPPVILINIVDATNLERHLFLTAQLIEMGIPIVLALNVMDEAEQRGLQIDVEKLALMLDLPVVRMVARRNKGTRELLGTIDKLVESSHTPRCTIDYGEAIENALRTLDDTCRRSQRICSRAELVGLLCDRQLAPAETETAGNGFAAAADRARSRIEQRFKDRIEHLITGRWYGFANGVARMCVSQSRQARFDVTEKLDNILTHPLFGMIVFAASMWLTFQVVFTLGQPLTALLDRAFMTLAGLVSAALPAGFVRSLLVDGIISGVGGVLVFLPNILLLFLVIGFYEDSGYMARAAFVMDNIMHRIGLHGKSFIPMLVGFGCTVPAIMATRGLDTRRDRLITALICPFMSCGARLPVYTLFISAFFAPRLHAPVMLSLYLLGILVAVLMAHLLGRLFFGREHSPLLMELPPYRLPTLRSTFILMWVRAWMYLKKAGTVLLLASIVMWYLSTHPRMTDAELVARHPGSVAAGTEDVQRLRAQSEFTDSYAARVGRVIEPVVHPLGFDWRISVALISGFMAKEAVVSTLSVVYGVGAHEDAADDLRSLLRGDPLFKGSPLTAYTFMVFVLLYLPCLGVVAVFLKEFGAKWTAFMVAYTTVTAYVVALLIRGIGLLLV
jgi:ferrous iron transport protein B